MQKRPAEAGRWNWRARQRHSDGFPPVCAVAPSWPCGTAALLPPQTGRTSAHRAGAMAFVDVNDTVKPTFGDAKQDRNEGLRPGVHPRACSHVETDGSRARARCSGSQAHGRPPDRRRCLDASVKRTSWSAGTLGPIRLCRTTSSHESCSLSPGTGASCTQRGLRYRRHHALVVFAMAPMSGSDR